MQIFAVRRSDEGYTSVWRTYDDAYAAAGETQAMDPEVCYSVDTIEPEEFESFWFHNPHLDLYLY